ncbi:MAG: hypothetical protein UZ22_OP11002000999 [Microgenomates bacterium OLB23]|nr:MAG: hypothetical protein UZ22_OP11002000999 [Microgenomates bacterium OLB23]
MLVPSLTIDFQIPLQSATLELAKKIAQLEPFGIGNAQPLFVSSGIIKDIIYFGKQKQYTRYLLHDGDMGLLEITFFEKASPLYTIGTAVAVAYYLKIDSWGGKIKLSAMGRYIGDKV